MIEVGKVFDFEVRVEVRTAMHICSVLENRERRPDATFTSSNRDELSGSIPLTRRKSIAS